MPVVDPTCMKDKQFARLPRWVLSHGRKGSACWHGAVTATSCLHGNITLANAGDKQKLLFERLASSCLLVASRQQNKACHNDSFVYLEELPRWVDLGHLLEHALLLLNMPALGVSEVQECSTYLQHLQRKKHMSSKWPLQCMHPLSYLKLQSIWSPWLHCTSPPLPFICMRRLWQNILLQLEGFVCEERRYWMT